MQNRGNLECSNNRILYDDLLDCQNVLKEEIIIPEGVTSLKENCLFKRRLKRLTFPKSMKSFHFHAINECIIGEFKLQSNALNVVQAFNNSLVNKMILTGESHCDLTLDGSLVQTLEVEEGVKTISVYGGKIKKAVLPGSLLVINGNTFTNNSAKSFDLSVSDRTWLEMGSLKDVTTLRIRFDINKGISALRHMLYILSSADCSKLQQVVLINSGLNVLEILRLKWEFKNIKFSVETLNVSTQLVEQTDSLEEPVVRR